MPKITIIQDLRVLPLKVTATSQTNHLIYIKEHAVRGQSVDKPQGRTLFILNIPPFVNENNLNNLFKECGEIASIELCDKPNSSDSAIDKSSIFSPKPKVCFKVGYIVFETDSGLDKALKLTELKPLVGGGNKLETGVVKWIKDYNAAIPDTKELKKEIETFMDVYDKNTQKQMNADKLMTEPDDEGWITVTKQSRKQGFQRNEATGNKIMAKEELKKKKKELKNFYTFQIRESKMKHIIALRQKFDEDKKKVMLLKESRRFKPF